jgi:hypothetical protein
MPVSEVDPESVGGIVIPDRDSQVAVSMLQVVPSSVLPDSLVFQFDSPVHTNEGVDGAELLVVT